MVVQTLLWWLTLWRGSSLLCWLFALFRNYLNFSFLDAEKILPQVIDIKRLLNSVVLQYVQILIPMLLEIARWTTIQEIRDFRDLVLSYRCYKTRKYFLLMLIAQWLLVLAEVNFNFPNLIIWKIKFRAIKASLETLYRTLIAIVVLLLVMLDSFTFLRLEKRRLCRLIIILF